MHVGMLEILSLAIPMHTTAFSQNFLKIFSTYFATRGFCAPLAPLKLPMVIIAPLKLPMVISTTKVCMYVCHAYTSPVFIYTPKSIDDFYGILFFDVILFVM